MQRYVHISKLEEAQKRIAELERQVEELQRSLEFARTPRFYYGRQSTEANGKPRC